MEEINLYDLVRFFIKKWLTIAIFVMVGAIAGIVYTFYVQAPQYTSKATILLIGTNRVSANQDSVTLNNYVELLTSHRVLDKVIADENYGKGYDSLVSGMTAQNVKNTDIIDVSISTADAKTSKSLLEGAIESFRTEAVELYGDSTIKINLVDAASLPTNPSNTKPLVQIALAIVAGFALSIVSLFFVYDYQLSQRKPTPVKKPATRAAATPKAKPVKKKAPAKKPAAKK